MSIQFEKKPFVFSFLNVRKAGTPQLLILEQSLIETFLNVYGANITLTLLCFSQLLADFHDYWKDCRTAFGLVKEELSHIVADSSFKFTPVEAVSCQVIFNGSIDNVSSLT